MQKIIWKKLTENCYYCTINIRSYVWLWDEIWAKDVKNGQFKNNANRR